MPDITQPPLRPARPSSTERRSHPRYSFTAAVEALDQGSRTRVNGRTSDLSRGGCYVDTICPFPVGTLAKLRLTKDKNSFEVEARVVYSQVGMGMGLVFTTALPEHLGIIDGWIGEVKGDLPARSDELGLPERDKEETAPARSKEEQRYVLSELVMLLLRKGVLTEAEGKSMLQRLYK